MKTGLICHRKLSDIASMVRKFSIKFKLASAKRSIECRIKLIIKLLRAAHEFYQIIDVMRNIPTIYPTIVFSVIFTCTHPSRETIVERLYKVSLCIFGMKKPCIRIKQIPIVKRVSGIFFFIFCFP